MLLGVCVVTIRLSTGVCNLCVGVTVCSESPGSLHRQPAAMGVLGGYIDTKRKAASGYIKVNIPEIACIGRSTRSMRCT